jgi:hypothetical protein
MRRRKGRWHKKVRREKSKEKRDWENRIAMETVHGKG